MSAEHVVFVIYRLRTRYAATGLVQFLTSKYYRMAALAFSAATLARICELFPLVCSRCGGEIEIMAFITEAPTVRATLTHIGESSEAPPISPCQKTAVDPVGA